MEIVDVGSPLSRPAGSGLEIQLYDFVTSYVLRTPYRETQVGTDRHLDTVQKVKTLNRKGSL